MSTLEEVEMATPVLPLKQEGGRKGRCSATEGCDKYAVMRGFCVSHARENLDDETFEKVHKMMGRCKMAQCEKKAVFRGFCQNHGKENLGDDLFKSLRRAAGR